jgi:hypothetical protein
MNKLNILVSGKKKQKRMYHLFFIGLVFLLSGYMKTEKALGQNTQNKYVEILPGDSKEEIIRKAANLTPSERQLRWQKMELTGFLHFGINTFTNREWGDGKEDPVNHISIPCKSGYCFYWSL